MVRRRRALLGRVTTSLREAQRQLLDGSLVARPGRTDGQRRSCREIPAKPRGFSLGQFGNHLLGPVSWLVQQHILESRHFDSSAIRTGR